jgi:hypothetical protein
LKLASNRTFLDSPHSPTLSTNPLVSALNYDTTTIVSETTKSFNNVTLSTYEAEKSDSVNILKGKRDGAPSFLSSTY